MKGNENEFLAAFLSVTLFSPFIWQFFFFYWAAKTCHGTTSCPTCYEAECCSYIGVCLCDKYDDEYAPTLPLTFPKLNDIFSGNFWHCSFIFKYVFRVSQFFVSSSAGIFLTHHEFGERMYAATTTTTNTIMYDILYVYNARLCLFIYFLFLDQVYLYFCSSHLIICLCEMKNRIHENNVWGKTWQ